MDTPTEIQFVESNRKAPREKYKNLKHQNTWSFLKKKNNNNVKKGQEVERKLAKIRNCSMNRSPKGNNRNERLKPTNKGKLGLRF